MNMMIRFAREVGAKVGEICTWSPNGKGSWMRLFTDCAEINGSVGDGLSEEFYVHETLSPGCKASWKEII